jgi:hypothetical protein
MNPALYDQLAESLEQNGPASAFATLVASLIEQNELAKAFDALVLQARFECGLPYFQADASTDPGPDVRDKYEEKLVAACRLVGQKFLEQGEIVKAHPYFQTIGDLEPIRQAIESYASTEADERTEQVIDLALAQGVHPTRGLEIILDRFGTCQAITACEQLLHQFHYRSSVAQGCIRLLVRRLYDELVERVGAEVSSREGPAAAAPSLAVLLHGRDWLCAEGAYHIDTSHLNTVVRMARLLPACDETVLAIQLCEYGCRLARGYWYADPPPFDEVYSDSLAYFKTLAGVDVEAGLAHFRQKAEQADPEESGALPAEVYVHLLTATGQSAEALAFAAKTLNRGGPCILCPSINDLCHAAGKYDALSELARERDDPVSYLAGLLVRRPSS